MNELLVAVGSAIAGIFIFRAIVKAQADSGQRELEIKSAVIDNKVENLENKAADIDKETIVEIKKIEQEQGKVLNAEELANWFNSRNKSDK
jgi:glutamine cyclotransferase